MKIEVTKRDLEVALNTANVGVAGTGADMTTHFIFRHVDGRVEVLANNGRLGVSSPLICNSQLSSDVDSFTVEAKRMKSWLSAVSDGVLTLEFDESDRRVVAKSPRGSITLNSLDPKNFPYWDNDFSSTEQGYSLKSKQLMGALNHVKLFVYEKDTKEPRLSVVEVKETEDGRILESTDRAALGMVKLAALQDQGAFRIHNKDLGNVLAFLNTIGDEPVEIREHDKRTFFVRGDGALLNVGRPKHAFPDFKVGSGDEADPYAWTFQTELLKSSIRALVAGAPREESKIHFALDRNQVAISMPSATTGRNTYQLELLESTNTEDKDFPEDGFTVPYEHLLKILNQYKSESVTVGLSPRYGDNGKVRGGHCRFQEMRGENQYSVILVWSA